MPAYSERPDIGWNLRWTPVIGGALCALASYIVIGLFGASLGWAAAADLSAGAVPRFFAVLIGTFIAPIVAGWIGGFVAARLVGLPGERNTMLYGLMSWCLALIVGLVFLGGPFSFGRSDIASRITSPESVSLFGRYAAWAGWTGLSALIGFGSAAWGAGMGRHASMGHRLLPRVRFERGMSNRTPGYTSTRMRDDLHADSVFRSGVHSDGTADPLGTPMHRSDLDDTDMRH
jgi:hypothetical protein